MESCLDVYKLTQNTSWLDKMVTHIDTMIGNAHDLDNDGYLGWDTARYSPQKISNTGFETAKTGDSTMAANWTRYQATSATAFRSASPTYAGSFSFTLKTNGTSWQEIYQNLTGYYPGFRYKLSFYGRTNGSAAGGQAFILDATTGVKLANIDFNETSFTYHEMTFTAPAAGHTLQVWLGHQAYNITNGTVIFDDVKVSMHSPYMHHDGMIGLVMTNVTANVILGTGIIDFNNTSWQTRTMTLRRLQTLQTRCGFTWKNHTLNQNGKASFDNVVIKRTGDAW